MIAAFRSAAAGVDVLDAAAPEDAVAGGVTSADVPDAVPDIGRVAAAEAAHVVPVLPARAAGTRSTSGSPTVAGLPGGPTPLGRTPRRAGRVTRRVVAAVGVVTLGSVGAAAAGGRLPDPVQRHVSRGLSNIGIDVPPARGDLDRGISAAAEVAVGAVGTGTTVTSSSTVSDAATSAAPGPVPPSGPATSTPVGPGGAPAGGAPAGGVPATGPGADPGGPAAVDARELRGLCTAWLAAGGSSARNRDGAVAVLEAAAAVSHGGDVAALCASVLGTSPLPTVPPVPPASAPASAPGAPASAPLPVTVPSGANVPGRTEPGRTTPPTADPGGRPTLPSVVPGVGGDGGPVVPSTAVANGPPVATLPPVPDVATGTTLAPTVPVVTRPPLGGGHGQGNANGTVRGGPGTRGTTTTTTTEPAPAPAPAPSEGP